MANDTTEATEPTAADATDNAVFHLLAVHREPQQMALYDTRVPGLTYAVGTTAENGLEIKPIDVRSSLPTPERVSGKRTVSELTSLLNELARFPLTAGTSTIWGDYVSGTVVAVYNDHTPGLAGWRDNELTLKLTKDPDWLAWHKISGTYFPQEEFGDIVEELLHTVIDPDQADLLEIIDSIRTSSKGSFESRITRSDGSQQLAYSEEVTATAGKNSRTLKVPQTIKLCLRPWEGHIQTYDIEAWFRLRVVNGQLGLAVKLKPTQQILREAWTDAMQSIVEQTSIPVLAFRGER